MAINTKTYRRSMGQFKRYHKTLILGSEDKLAPYFKVTQEMYQFKRLYPTKAKMVTRYENKMLKARSLATQNKLRIEMMEKLRGNSK